MILLCGGTGELGGRIARLLHERGRAFRVLVRPQTDGSGLAALGEVVQGDLRSSESLLPALDGVVTVVTTANAIGRKLAGQKDLSIDQVDHEGNANLVAAAETSGVSRFVLCR
jgi:NADH dehydrogenase